MRTRLGTRGSDLALWQARHVAERLGVESEIVIIRTRGDEITNVPLTAVSGKAFFTAEIEQALRDHRVDVAVHSFKDLTTAETPGLVVAAVTTRGPADEALVIAASAYDEDAPWLPLRHRARVGTSAPRRAEQLRALRPDLFVDSLRGNVPTRVERVRSGRYDAVLIARAGLERLGLDTSDLRMAYPSPDLIVPAPAQGALAVQIRETDGELRELCQARLHDEQTAAMVRAERALLVWADAGCSLPLGVYVTREDAGYRARAFFGAHQPVPDAPARWSTDSGSTPDEAVHRVWAHLQAGTPTGHGPLAGLRVAVLGTGREKNDIVQRLETLGGRVRSLPVLAYEDVRVDDLDARLSALGAGDVLAVTSQHVAQRLSGLRVNDEVVVGAVGERTAQAVERVGIKVSVVAQGSARSLGEMLPAGPGTRVLFPCAEAAGPDLEDTLRARGVDVDRLVVYRTVETPTASTPTPPDSEELRVYLSPSAVRASINRGWETPSQTVTRVGMGRSTASTLREAGLAHLPPTADGPDAVVDTVFRFASFRVASLAGRVS